MVNDMNIAILSCLRLRPQTLEGNLWKVYGLAVFFQGLAISVPTLYHLWSECGLSAVDIMTLQGVFALSVALCEVPSGYIADLFGRKWTIVAGSVCILLGGYVYCLAENFNVFACAEILLAFGCALQSGAVEALLYDTLIQLDKVHLFTKLWGRYISVQMIGAGIAFLVGGVVVASDLRAPLYFAMYFYAALVLFALMLVEPERSKRELAGGHLREIGRIAKFCFYEQKSLGWIILFNAIVSAAMQVAFWLYQPYFIECGIPLSYNGAILACLVFTSAFMATKATKIDTNLGVNFFSLYLLIIASSFLLSGSFVGFQGVAFILMHQIARGPARVIFSRKINALTSSEIRATTLSINSMAFTLLYSIALIPAGWAVDRYGVVNTFLVLAIVLAIIGGACLQKKPLEGFE